MTPPISKNPPRGTRLEAIVRALEVLRKHEEWEKSDDPRLRSLGVDTKLEEEPRIWMLPRELVRDHIVLPQIASVDGQAAADAMKSLMPHTLDEHVKITCDLAKKNATARERLAPPCDASALVMLAVIGVLLNGWQAGRSPTSQYIRAAKHLGVDRGFVRRTHKKVICNLARFQGEALEQLAKFIYDAGDLVCSLSEMTSGPSRGRRDLSVSRKLVSPRVEQGSSRPSES